MNIFMVNFNLIIRQMVEAMLITAGFVIGHIGAENMRFIAASLIWFIIGIWIGKKISDRKWISNAEEISPIEYNGWLYKVVRERKTEDS